ncbi:MAG: glycosyltransferase family 4 protein [Patescibacteria group bacterium]|mgnify:CR=1 FL=1
MKILILSGLAKSDIGGPTQYTGELAKEFQNLGHEVKIVSYTSMEKRMSVFLRHIYFLFKVVGKVIWSDKILALDTYSTGVPAVLLSKLFRKKLIARVGGDYLWSAYVNRTSKPITLPLFYDRMPELSKKERLIYLFMGWMIRHTDFLAFNTEWQRGIWQKFYRINESRSGVVRNFIPENRKEQIPSLNNFLWAGRLIPEKNIPMLKKLGIEIATGESHERILERIKGCYAAVTLAFTDVCPNFIIEAVSFRKPFIATHETGLSEIFPIGGIYVNPLDDKEIERAMQALLDSGTYNKKVLELDSLKLNHSWREMAQEYIEIWNRI